jgi:hypothetical protein
MGRAALYREPSPFRPARAELQLDLDFLAIAMPSGWTHRHPLDGCAATTSDGFVWGHGKRRFVRMLAIERAGQRAVVITPPDRGAVAPNVVRVPEAPPEAAIVDEEPWDALVAWLLGGGRLAAYAIADLAQLATIATPQFAVLIGEVAAQRALELAWVSAGPLRDSSDVESALQPLVDVARASPRAAEALVSALAHAAGARHGRRR